MTERKKSLPNFLVVMADQLTPFALGCYGSPVVKSPHIDRLAGEGVQFDAAYSNSPLCTPGRYAFMTGQYVSRNGGFDNAAYMPSTQPTFAHYLRMMGYRTALSGKMHFVGPDQLHGFEERYTTDVYPADFGWVPDWEHADQRIDLWYHNMSSVTQAGVAAITNQLEYDDEVGTQAERALYHAARSTDERPFCLVASFIHPHDPYAARQQYWDLYDGVDIPPPHVKRPAASDNDPHSLRLEKVIALDAVDLSEEEIATARRAYYANVSYVDAWLGRLRAVLEETGQAENTAILFISDHGDMLGERGLWYKMSFFEPSCRVPLILHWPERFSAKRVGAPVSQIDVLPTLVDLAAQCSGAAAPHWVDPVDGRSLLDLADGRINGDPGRSLAEYLAEGTAQPMLMIRRGSWKFTCCPGDPDQLFDLAADPHELRDLAMDPKHTETLAGLRIEANAHWDAADVREAVVASQNRRRVLAGALAIGRKAHWDFQPLRDAKDEYTRSHMDLTTRDGESRWPRPPNFSPRWR